MNRVLILLAALLVSGCAVGAPLIVISIGTGVALDLEARDVSVDTRDDVDVRTDLDISR